MKTNFAYEIKKTVSRNFAVFFCFGVLVPLASADTALAAVAVTKRVVSIDSCVDSDGGIAYYTKGTVDTADAGSRGHYIDICSDGKNQLHEWYCKGMQPAEITKDCPNGCQDGACRDSGIGPEFSLEIGKRIYSIGDEVMIRANFQDIDQQHRSFIKGVVVAPDGSFETSYFYKQHLSGVETSSALIKGSNLVSGRSGSAFSFDGNTYIGDLPGFGKKDDVTISMWFKTKVGGKFYEAEYYKDSGDHFAPKFSIRKDNGTVEYFAFVNNNGTRNDLSVSTDGSYDYRDDKWHLFTAVFRGGDFPKGELYVDGKFIGEDVDTPMSNFDWDAPDMKNVNLGYACGYHYRNCIDWSDGFVGDIDQVRVYKRALSQSEAGALYSDINVSKKNLEVLWDFERTEKEIVFDSSGNGNNGVFHNASEVGGENVIYVNAMQEGVYRITATADYQGKTGNSYAEFTVGIAAIEDWDVSVNFDVANKGSFYPFSSATGVVGNKYYAKLNATDDLYDEYIGREACTSSYWGDIFEAEQARRAKGWYAERKRMDNGDYKILIRGTAPADCGYSSPGESKGELTVNPYSDWKIKEVVKCNAQGSNKGQEVKCESGDGYIEFSAGSNCGGCCACADSGSLDIEVILGKNGGSSPVKPQGSCTDTDEGQDVFRKGDVVYMGKTNSDQCVSQDTLKEYYCEKDGRGKAADHVCENGCEDGACIKTDGASDNNANDDALAKFNEEIENSGLSGVIVAVLGVVLSIIIIIAVALSKKM